MQNRERTGVPKRAARLVWWMRPDASVDDSNKAFERPSTLNARIRSLPLSVPQWLHFKLEFAECLFCKSST